MMNQIRYNLDMELTCKPHDFDALNAAACLLGISTDTLPPRNIEAAQVGAEQAYVGDLTDSEFDALRPHLPPESRLVHSTTNRHVLDALIWAHRTQRMRTQLPTRYGTLDSVRKRSERWGTSGAWDRLLERLPTLALPDMRQKELVDIAIAEARRGRRIRAFRSNLNATSRPRGRA